MRVLKARKKSVRRQIRQGSDRATSSIRPTQLEFSSRFQWAAVLIFATSILFGVMSVYFIQRGYTQTPAMFYALLISSSVATVMQMVNLWRGRLITTFLQFLWMLANPRTSGQGVVDEGLADGNMEAQQTATQALLKGITCSCEKKGQAVGVCHHCGRFVCKIYGHEIRDKRFTIPNKLALSKKKAWHCQKCLRQYHPSEWRYRWLLSFLRRLINSLISLSSHH